MSGRAKPLAIVTGASRGLGAAIAASLANAGYDLALISQRDGEAAHKVASEARSLGADTTLHFGDISNEATVKKMFDEAESRGQELAALVNNAGVTGERCDLAELPIEAFDRVFAVNVRGAVLCCQHATPLMARAGGGAIVNVSSQSGTYGGAGLTAYAASKAALNGLTISLAREVAPLNIRVSAVSPGPVLTEPLRALSADKLEQMRRTLPLGRFCTPEEVGETVCWLLSAKASYISGAVIPVHGGR